MVARKPKPRTPEIDAPSAEGDALSTSELETLLQRMQIDASGPSALTAEEVDTWVKSSGWTPVEFLTHVYRNPWMKMDQRINAAKSVLEYAHRKLPSKLEVEGKGGISVRNIDAAALAKLNGKDLAALEKLLEKMG